MTRTTIHSKAFTIVEVLVVISIITLLLSMLAPGLSNSRASARMTICASNLRQLGIAIDNYSTELWYYPIAIDDHADNNQRVWLWPTLTRLYTNGDQDVFTCPQAPGTTRWVYSETAGEPAYYGYKENETRIRGYSHKFSYGYNCWGAFIGQTPNTGMGGYKGIPHHWAKRERVKNPSGMIAFTDSNVNDYWSGYIGPYRWPGQWPSRIHFGNPVVVFCDNSARMMDRADVTDVSRPEVNRRWNNHNNVVNQTPVYDGVPDFP